VSDEKLRELERAFQESESEEAELAWLRERARAGEKLNWESYSRLHELDVEAAAGYLQSRLSAGSTSRPELELAALCGHAAAQSVSGMPPLPASLELAEWLAPAEATLGPYALCLLQLSIVLGMSGVDSEVMDLANVIFVRDQESLESAFDCELSWNEAALRAESRTAKTAVELVFSTVDTLRFGSPFMLGLLRDWQLDKKPLSTTARMLLTRRALATYPDACHFPSTS